MIHKFLCVFMSVSQKHLRLFDCNFKKINHYILTIFGTNIPDTICHQITIQFPTSPNVCFCTTSGKHNQRNITFYPMRNDCFINITRKNTSCSHFWQFIQLSIFHLPAVKLPEVFAHYANTGKKTFSLFIDTSIDNVLLQTNPGCTSRFLTLQTFLNFIWQIHCCMTVKTCNGPAVGQCWGRQIRMDGIYWRFFVYCNAYYAWSAFPR